MLVYMCLCQNHGRPFPHLGHSCSLSPICWLWRAAPNSPIPPESLWNVCLGAWYSHPGSPCLSWDDLTSLPPRGSLQDPVLYITHPSIPIADTTASHPGLTWNKWAGTASWLFSQQGSTGIVEEVFWIWRHSHLRDKLWPGEEQAATPSSGSAGTLSP